MTDEDAITRNRVGQLEQLYTIITQEGTGEWPCCGVKDPNNLRCLWGHPGKAEYIRDGMMDGAWIWSCCGSYHQEAKGCKKGVPGNHTHSAKYAGDKPLYLVSEVVRGVVDKLKESEAIRSSPHNSTQTHATEIESVRKTNESLRQEITDLRYRLDSMGTSVAGARAKAGAGAEEGKVAETGVVNASNKGDLVGSERSRMVALEEKIELLTQEAVEAQEYKLRAERLITRLQTALPHLTRK